MNAEAEVDLPGLTQAHLRSTHDVKRWPPALRVPMFFGPATKDPIGANLECIQLIKGWLDAKGELHEKVYDLTWSGPCKPGPDGKPK
jgi:hypothetical protein